MYNEESLTKSKDLSKPNSEIEVGDLNIFTSNRLDCLIDLFTSNLKFLLQQDSLRQIVIVPSNVIKNLLIQSLKKKWGVYFATRFLSLPQAVEHAIKLSLSENPFFPHHHHLMIFLDHALEELCTKSPEKFPSLTRYIHKSPETRLSLAEQLSHVFLFYGLYGLEALDEWEKKPDWQQHLFSQAKQHWDFPYTLMQKKIVLKIETHFHLFCLPTLPLVYRQLFSQIGATIYHRMATPHYVGDLLSDASLSRIDTKLEKKKISLDEREAFSQLGKEPNRIFANYAQASIPYSNWLQEQENHSFFFPPHNQFQRSFYDLEPLPQGPHNFSMELLAAPNRIGEVEAIYHKLLTLFHNDPTLKTEDVQIFAPDIEPYVAAIEYVFGQKCSPFGYIISEVPEAPSTIRSFFQLTQGRFELKPLSSICEGKNMKPFFDLLETYHVRWGYDREMRQEILGSDNVFAQGTFKDAFDKILYSLAYLSSSVDLSLAEELGDFILFIEKMAIDIRALKNGNKKIGEWVETISDLTLQYLPESDEVTIFLKQLAKLSALIPIVLDEIPFSPILKVIEEITAKREGVIANTQKPPLFFSSLGEGKLTAPKVTIMMSMDEEAFPRTEMRRSIDQLRGKPGSDFHPSITQKDKLFFFEALAYTTSKIIFSYTDKSDADGKQLSPSLLLEDLELQPTFIPLHLPHTKEIETLHMSSPVPLPPLESLDLSHLTRVATHPLRFYLQIRCGIYLETEEEETGEFLLSYQTRAQIRQKAYLEPKEKLLKEIELRGELPTTLFSTAARKEVNDQIEEADRHLKGFGLTRDDIVTIILDPAVEKATQRSENEFLHPPIIVDDLFIYGDLGLVTKRGLLCFGEKSSESLWKMWPKLLLLTQLREFSFPTTILFTKGCEIFNLQIKDPLASLKLFVEYTRQALERPSPLRSKSFFYDPYLEMIEPDLSIDWNRYFKEVDEIL